MALFHHFTMHQVWDHVFLDATAPTTSIVPAALAKMKKEFSYWYPLDLR